ncbi:MAG: hypothetical protein ACI8Z7_000299 [Candidatus Nanohaloarchaea archaeon]
MRRREFIKSIGALGSGGLLDSDSDIHRLSDLNQKAQQAMSICEGQMAEEYVLCQPSGSESYQIVETSNTDLIPEAELAGDRAGYSLVRETEQSYPESLEVGDLALPETRSMGIYLADPVFLGLETDWVKKVDRTASELENVRKELQRTVEDSEGSGLQISDLYASGALEALSMTYQLEKGLENIESQAYGDVSRALIEETPQIIDGELYDFNGDGEFTEADIFRAAYLSNDQFFQDFVPHIMDYDRDEDIDQDDLQILYSRLAEENPGEVMDLLEGKLSAPDQLDRLNSLIGNQGAKRESQEPIEIELYGTNQTQVFLEPAKNVVEAVIGNFYHDSMYNISIDYSEIELEGETSRERLEEFEEIAGEGERDYQLLIDVDPIGEKRSIVGLSELDQLFEEDGTSTGIALLNSQDRVEMITEPDEFPLIVDELDSRGIIAHELFHGLGVGHQKSDIFTDTSGDRDLVFTTPVGLGYISYMRYEPEKAERALGEELFNHFSSQLGEVDMEEAEVKTVMAPSSEALETILETNISSQN